MSTATTHIKTEKRSAERSRSKLAPALRFKEFDGEWCKDKIGNITNVTSGGTPSTLKPEYWGGDIRWMNSGDLNLKRVFEVKNRITEKGLEKSSTKIIPVNSILIGLAGQGKTRGTAAMNIVELCINQSIAAILPAENFDSEFLYQNIDGRYEELRRLSTGDGGRGGLNLQIIKGFYVPVPTLPEQQKIASFLSTIDEKIQQLTKKKELLEQYKKGVMQQLFPSTGSGQRSGQLRFKPARPAGGDENLSADRHDGNPYPEWKEKKISQVVTEVNERTIENNQFEVLSSTKSGIVLQSEYFNKQVASSDSSNYKIVRKGMFSYRSMSDTGSFTFNIQNVIEIGIVSPAYPVFKVNENQSAFYLYLTLNNSSHFKSQLLAMMEGGTRLALGFSKFKKMIVHLPSFEEQQKIATYLSSIDTKIEAVNTQITQTQTFKKGLLQQMFV
jgi:type I restriction enzyme S subunit